MMEKNKDVVNTALLEWTQIEKNFQDGSKKDGWI